MNSVGINQGLVNGRQISISAQSVKRFDVLLFGSGFGSNIFQFFTSEQCQGNTGEANGDLKIKASAKIVEFNGLLQGSIHILERSSRGVEACYHIGGSFDHTSQGTVVCSNGEVCARCNEISRGVVAVIHISLGGIAQLNGLGGVYGNGKGSCVITLLNGKSLFTGGCGVEAFNGNGSVIHVDRFDICIVVSHSQTSLCIKGVAYEIILRNTFHSNTGNNRNLNLYRLFFISNGYCLLTDLIFVVTGNGYTCHINGLVFVFCYCNKSCII